MSRAALHVVWFKRDLRSTDHAPLIAACEAGGGAVLPLYIAEPGWWREPDMAARHWAFVSESLQALNAELSALGQPLVIRSGEAVAVLADLHHRRGIAALYSHEETGGGWTYIRDLRVADWCRHETVPWHEWRQSGVIRRLKTRDGWARRWDGFMAKPLAPGPSALSHIPGVASQALPTAEALGLAADACPERQRGGRPAALQRLDSFLTRRGERYRWAMSAPESAATACSRLSPHLAWGTLSMREVTQATWATQRARKAEAGSARTPWRQSLASFNSRLHWHCHFMQKLEDAPRLEFDNLHPAYDGLRPSTPDPARLAAWCAGETGLPFVDACMRALRATGWLNFRMRAMLMAVASYHLWLDWRAPGLHLARLFTDYEPGIHWPQVQMQSGTTGINTPRIYNPVKQGQDLDPEGAFIRRWVPELADLDANDIHTPWTNSRARGRLGKTYPQPVVDPLAAARHARDAVWAVRRQPGFREQAAELVKRHASREGPNDRTPRRRRRPAPPTTPSAQLDLGL